MATMKDSRMFFEQGTAVQFEYVYKLYDEALKLKAEQKNKKFEELQKLDKWYQLELPKKIKNRGKEAHLTHDELVQCMKWKLARGKWRPRLKELVQMNTPRLVHIESKKAFRQLSKRNDLSLAIQALCNLKGVGPAMASAILAAGFPEKAPFMADECLMAIPDFEGIDYTLTEYLKFADKLKNKIDGLNNEGYFIRSDCILLRFLVDINKWTPHRLELALWSYYVLFELKPSLLGDMPGFDQFMESKESRNGSSLVNEHSNDSLLEKDEASNCSLPSSPNPIYDNTNDSVSQSDTEYPHSNGNSNVEIQHSSTNGVVCDEIQPAVKKTKVSE